jgi:hypothetical protein
VWLTCGLHWGVVDVVLVPHHGKNYAEKAENAAIVFFSWVV